MSCTHIKGLEKLDCLENLEMAQGFKPYNGEDLACNFFIQQYDYDGELLFVLNNNCADIVYSVVDCYNNDVTEKYGYKINNLMPKIVAIREN